MRRCELGGTRTLRDKIKKEIRFSDMNLVIKISGDHLGCFAPQSGSPPPPSPDSCNNSIFGLG